MSEPQITLITGMTRMKSIGLIMGVMRESLLLSREAMALRYPASANSWRIHLYYPLRFRDILRRQGTIL